MSSAASSVRGPAQRGVSVASLRGTGRTSRPSTCFTSKASSVRGSAQPGVNDVHPRAAYGQTHCGDQVRIARHCSGGVL